MRVQKRLKNVLYHFVKGDIAFGQGKPVQSLEALGEVVGVAVTGDDAEGFLVEDVIVEFEV